MPVQMTATGFIDALNPKIEDINIADIAIGLSNACRWGNQTPRFFSVAQHSINVALRVPPEHVLHALLHDAAEAYLGDEPRPRKAVTRYGDDPYTVVEDRLLGLILTKYGLAPSIPAEVWAADDIECERERRAVMRGLEVGWAPDVARKAWLRMFNRARIAAWVTRGVRV